MRATGLQLTEGDLIGLLPNPIRSLATAFQGKTIGPSPAGPMIGGPPGEGGRPGPTPHCSGKYSGSDPGSPVFVCRFLATVKPIGASPQRLQNLKAPARSVTLLIILGYLNRDPTYV